MQTDSSLVDRLLVMLRDVETNWPHGTTGEAMQPKHAGSPGTVEVSGFSWEQIDHHLRILVQQGLVDGDEIGEGIWFRSLTSRGHSRAPVS